MFADGLILKDLAMTQEVIDVTQILLKRLDLTDASVSMRRINKLSRDGA
jgi:hypothetical protein